MLAGVLHKRVKEALQDQNATLENNYSIQNKSKGEKLGLGGRERKAGVMTRCSNTSLSEIILNVNDITSPFTLAIDWHRE